MSQGVLRGQTVVVTRPGSQAGPFSRKLRSRGARVLEFPTIRILPPEDAGPLREAAAALQQYDWVVFTSVNGVRWTAKILEDLPGPPDPPTPLRAAAIGPATADAVRELGLEVDVVPGEYRAEALAEALLNVIPEPSQTRLLLPRAAGARPVLRQLLEEAGARVDEVEAYRAAPVRHGGDLRRRLEREEPGWITFTASSTVRNFVAAAGADVGTARVAAIGPVTAGTARELGLPVHVVAEEYTIPGLLDALCQAVQAGQGERSGHGGRRGRRGQGGQRG